MSPAAAFSIAVVCEGPTDLRTATELADRILCDSVDWITAETLEVSRQWRGFEETDEYLAWKKTPELARKHQIKVHGPFGKLPDYRTARSALLLLKLRKPDAVIFIRDSDGDGARKESLEQARQELAPGQDWPFPVVIGIAHTKRECWVLAGFDPQTSEEAAALAELRQELGSDPRYTAETLVAKAPRARRNAKYVLQRLTGDSSDRERSCWLDCSLDALRERGRSTGLADYLDELRSRLVPLFTNKSIPS